MDGLGAVRGGKSGFVILVAPLVVIEIKFWYERYIPKNDDLETHLGPPPIRGSKLPYIAIYGPPAKDMILVDFGRDLQTPTMGRKSPYS